MKRNISQIARCTAVMLLSCTAVLTSCSKDDEPSVDEILSEETTPVDFEITNFDWTRDAMLFDYAGNNYVGSDTFSRGRNIIDLRQGRHHLVWFIGLAGDKIEVNWTNGGDNIVWRETPGPHYDPISRNVTNNSSSGMTSMLSYCEHDLEVRPYPMSVQKFECSEFLTANVSVIVTDAHPDFPNPELTDTGGWGAEYEAVGSLAISPSIKAVSLNGSLYETDKEEYRNAVYARSSADYVFSSDVEKVKTGPFCMLCPEGGLNGISLAADVHDMNGCPVSTTPIPKFSIRRGYTTVLCGPLFSGSASDWTVEMRPYAD